MNRIPTLDGWRGLAIALVLFDHGQHALLEHYACFWTQTGNHGVNIFFVLSGFLITSKLMEGPINLKRFYLRRFFRLIPVSWCYLATLLALGYATHFRIVAADEVWACVLFYRNFTAPTMGGFSGHFWSLSLEEQFYLVWPCILLLAGVRRCRWIALSGAIACAFYRWLYWANYDRNVLNSRTQVRADALLIGCLLALMLAEPRFRNAIARLSRYFLVPALAALLFGIATVHWLPPLYESVAIAALIAASMAHPDSFLTRPLRNPALCWLGTVSYSVYVWQQFFFVYRTSTPIVIFTMCLMPLFALGSYYWIERPFTRLGHRLTAGKASDQSVSNACAPVALHSSD
jgi:peptidoglycan/LPS O-acetylase OafA/YrhL